MLDFKNKIAYNGNGTIGVFKSKDCTVIGLEEIASQEIGVNILEDKEKRIDKLDGSKTVIFEDFSKDDIRGILSRLDEVSEISSRVVFLDNWILDFSKYNKESVNVYKYILNNISIHLSHAELIEEKTKEIISDLVPVFVENLEINNLSEFSMESTRKDNTHYKLTFERLN